MTYPDFPEPDIPPLTEEEFEAILDLMLGPHRKTVDVNLDDWEDTNGTND